MSLVVMTLFTACLTDGTSIQEPAADEGYQESIASNEQNFDIITNELTGNGMATLLMAVSSHCGNLMSIIMADCDDIDCKNEINQRSLNGNLWEDGEPCQLYFMQGGEFGDNFARMIADINSYCGGKVNKDAGTITAADMMRSMFCNNVQRAKTIQ